jgi:phosphomannomutase
MVARRKASLRTMLERLFAEVGQRVPLRRDVMLSPLAMEQLPGQLAQRPDSIGAFGVERLVTIDGTKHVLEGDRWVLLRASGTEPLVRLYVEGRTRAEAEHLLDAAAEIFLPRAE